MIDVSDNYHKPLSVLTAELNSVSNEIAVHCKSCKKLSKEAVETYRVKVNALISAILSGFRFKSTRRGTEFKFRICPPHRVPRPSRIYEIHSKIEIAAGLMHKLQQLNGVTFEAPEMSKYRTLNDVKKDIEFLLTADMETSDFMYIYQLRLNAERNAKLIALLALGAILLGIGVAFYLKRTKNIDDEDYDDDDDDEISREEMMDQINDDLSNDLEEMAKDL